MIGLPVQRTAIWKLFVVFFLTSAGVIGCSDFNFYSLLDGDAKGGDTGELLKIVPTKTEVTVGDEFSFSATGGTPPYFFLVAPGGSGTIDSATGRYIAPNIPSLDFIRVVDDVGNESEAQIVVVE